MEYLWRDVSAGQFSELLIQIGDGNYPESEKKIIIPLGLGMVAGSLKDFLTEIYPDATSPMSKKNLWIRWVREPF